MFEMVLSGMVLLVSAKLACTPKPASAGDSRAPDSAPSSSTPCMRPPVPFCGVENVPMSLLGVSSGLLLV
jgi:hypothetical protein